MELFLVRHGKSLRSKVGIWGRLYDADIDPEYLFELAKSKSELSNISEMDIFSSPLIRCINTARLIFGELQQITKIEELKAYHSGSFEDKNESFIKENYPDYLTKSFKEKFCDPKYGEEGIIQQTERVLSGFKKVLLQSSKNNVVISTHFSVINVIANFVTDNFVKTTYAEGKFDIKEGGYISVRINKGIILNNIEKYG